MRVEVSFQDRTFRYRLHPEDSDPREGRRTFADNPSPLSLARLEYQVSLPEQFTRIHPDVHAAAVWHAIRPFVGSRLELPFGVSSGFAAAMQRVFGIGIGPVDPSCAPRERPIQAAPALLFSGGMDSMAAGLLFPENTRILFMDRIPRPPSVNDPNALIDLARQRDACDAMRADGRAVWMTRDDHEHLFDPYPVWHSDMTILTPLYLADSLGIGAFDTGEVLDAIRLGGYCPEPASWCFREAPVEPPIPSPDDPRALLRLLGLSRAQSISGLSEVATAGIVARSRHRGKSFSCYYRTDASFCLRCDKCFKKLLLTHIAAGETTPASLIDHFLSFGYLRRIFTRRYLDWHHVWYYLFQKLRCDHWFVRELQRQARAGPDLTLLEKWYPPSRDLIVECYRDELVARILNAVPPMTDAEVVALEHLEVPPFDPPDLSRYEETATSVPVHPPEPLNAELASLLARVRDSFALGRFAGFQVSDVRANAGDGCVYVTLESERAAGPQGRLIMMVQPLGDPAASVFARVGSLGLSYHSSTPLDTPGKRAAAAGFQEHLATLAAAPLPSSHSP